MPDLTAQLNNLAGIPVDQRIGAAGAASLWATGAIGTELVGALNAKAGTRGLELSGALRRLGWDLDENRALTGVDGADGVAGPTGVANALRLPGSPGNYVSTPDSAAISITGDIDIRAKVTPDDWSGTQTFVGKWIDATNRSFVFRMQAATLRSIISTTGSDASFTASSAAVSFANGQTGWVRMTRVSATGFVNFYTSTDGITWTLSGAADRASTAGALFDGTSPLLVGAYNTNLEPFSGVVHYAQVLDGIGGTPVATFDASTVAVRGDQSPSTWTGPQGNVWTITGTKWWWTTSAAIRFKRALRLPGTAGNYASQPDTAGTSITGDIDIRAKVTADFIGGSTARAMLSKRNTDGTLPSYLLRINNGGQLEYVWWSAGVATTQSSSATLASHGIVAGQSFWGRVTHDVDNGAAGNTVRFYYSTDGITWTQSGIDRVAAGVTTIDDTAAIVQIGGAAATQEWQGLIHYAEVRSGIGGTVAASFDGNRARITGDQNPSTIPDPNGQVWSIQGTGWRWEDA